MLFYNSFAGAHILLSDGCPSIQQEPAMENPSGAQQEDMRALIERSTTRLVEQANDGLRRMTDKMRGKDLDQIVRDAEAFARQRPAAFLGAAAIAGFLAVRFLKSSSSSSSHVTTGARDGR
jgi:ElaB/YqjD/DUF883 family membrane-anchored ribosome-binding protein